MILFISNIGCCHLVDKCLNITTEKKTSLMLLLIITWTCRAAGLIPVFKGDAVPQNPEHRNKDV